MVRKYYIFDVDGTLSLVGDRVKCLEKGDWDTFYNRCDEDEPNQPVIDLLKTLLGDGENVLLLTGRVEKVRKKTLNWLRKHGVYIIPNQLLMREDGDTRHDTVGKPEQLEKAGLKLEQIKVVFEDRNSMVAYWREQGVPCWQVAEGDF